MIDMTTPPRRDHRFHFHGGDVAPDSRFVWAGFVGAPYGHLHEDGFRLRVMGGGGGYRYRSDAVPGGVNDARLFSGEILLGFRRGIGVADITAYLGAHAENHRLALPDAGHRSQGTTAGFKAAIELYMRLSPDYFTALSASASTVHASYHARGAVGREYPKGFAVGIEASVNGDARYSEPRGGLFARMTYRRTMFTLSGGYLSNSENGNGPYATLSVYTPY